MYTMYIMVIGGHMTIVEKRISAKEARETFSTVINEVAFGHKHYTITRHDKDAVVILPADEWRAIEQVLQKMEDDEDIRDADAAHVRYEKEGGVSNEEMNHILGM